MHQDQQKLVAEEREQEKERTNQHQAEKSDRTKYKQNNTNDIDPEGIVLPTPSTIFRRQIPSGPIKARKTLARVDASPIALNFSTLVLQSTAPLEPPLAPPPRAATKSRTTSTATKNGKYDSVSAARGTTAAPTTTATPTTTETL